MCKAVATGACSSQGRSLGPAPWAGGSRNALNTSAVCGLGFYHWGNLINNVHCLSFIFSKPGEVGGRSIQEGRGGFLKTRCIDKSKFYPSSHGAAAVGNPQVVCLLFTGQSHLPARTLQHLVGGFINDCVFPCQMSAKEWVV